MQLSRFCLAGMLSLVAAGASAGTVGIHKCTGSDGKVSYQQHACAVQQRAEVVVVEGEIDADRKAEADAIAKINRITPPPRMAPGEQQLAEIEPEQNAPVHKKAQCPPTRENPGTVTVSGYRDPLTGAVDMSEDLSAAYAWYQELPSRTYLKNAGRWPKECD